MRFAALTTSYRGFVYEAATVGLLQGIQNVASHENGLDAGLFPQWLMPESAKQWDRLNRFWHGDIYALREGDKVK